MLGWLAAQPAVHWLAPRAALRLANWQGTAITQSAAAAPDAPAPLTEVPSLLCLFGAVTVAFTSSDRPARHDRSL